ncbi:hypothetical protein JOD57_004705 [Geodermatophilus bullaregiensis]|uniref:hypothetical protein n=1 Tax=Geodermatophilus bullaregiensis TaxID=1564160 RepID=UPI001957AA16|nr:hypothetical protein [Geodermatophilus bullaregiensis]MBM7808868.1 hypothetical protein [Geodermatophilus bullaregiensis]
MEPAARIVVRRPGGGYRDRWRSYVIEVDGVRAGTVARGEQVELPVAPGRHSVRAVIDWSGSPLVQVEVAAGATAHLTVQPAGSATSALTQLWGRDSWLVLREE